MKTTYIALLIGIGLLLSVITPALAESTIEGINNVAFEEAEEIEDVTSGSSVIEEKLIEKTNEFYESIEQLFVLYGVAPESEEETPEGTYILGEYEFYFEEKEDGYYFTDVDGTSYYIDNFTISQSVYSHLSQISKTLDKISLAIEEGNTGRAFGLLTSLEARLTTTEKYLEKDATRAQLKEQNELKLQEKLEERERIKLLIQEKKEQKTNNSTNSSKGNSSDANDNGNSGGNDGGNIGGGKN
jgi:ABC-type Na+ efflux pump permease subunit